MQNKVLNARKRRKKSNDKYLANQSKLINELSDEERVLFEGHQLQFLSQEQELIGEIWMDLKLWGGIYLISNYCRIKNVLTNKIRKPHLHHSGYYTTCLQIDGQKQYSIYSRIIAFNFISNPEMLPEVNHKNKIRIDNRPSNLEWSTSKENAKHKIDNLDFSIKKKIIQMDMEGNELKEWDSILEAARSLGKSSGNIVSALKGRYHYTYGFKWKYKEAV